MLHDAVFTEETTPDDLALAQALLAERSAEEIAAALARLYRARLPSPEDILDPGERSGRPREDRSRDDRGRDTARASRGDDRPPAPRSKTGKTSSRHGMGEASVWFRAAIGRRKNAEARWLLPMICRRGGIDRQDIGAIKISDTTTEFEIAERVADAFAANIRRPDKEDSIRIEPLAGAPSGPPPSERRSHAHRSDTDQARHSAAPRGKPHDEEAPKQRSKPHREGKAKFGGEPAFGKKKHRDKPGPAAHKPRFDAPRGKGGKAANGRKLRNKQRG
jgi:ATP-dependent RNA helicase DeaD